MKLSLFNGKKNEKFAETKRTNTRRYKLMAKTIHLPVKKNYWGPKLSVSISDSNILIHKRPRSLKIFFITSKILRNVSTINQIDKKLTSNEHFSLFNYFVKRETKQ